MRVAFVCWGNICRSPMMERVFNAYAADAGLDVKTESFGVSDEELGNPIDPRAAAVLRREGYDAENHAARRMSADDLSTFDLVVAAEESHRKALLRLAPDADVVVLSSFDPDAESVDLPDPWYGDAEGFNDTLAAIRAAMPGLVDEVRRRS